MKIALINVKYSPNLGDGVIADCLESEIRKRVPGATVISIDVGGRDDFGRGGSLAGKSLGLMRIVKTLPLWLQNRLYAHLLPILINAKYGKPWEEQLRDCDAVVIGGGQLFQDVDLYFPMRIARAVRSAPKGISIAVYAVGVSKTWSRQAARFFNSAFRHGNLRFVAVRDRASQQHWSLHFPSLEAHIARDPGLLAADHYGNAAGTRGASNRKILAIGVSDLYELQQHSESAADVAFGQIDFYQALIRRLGNSFDIRLFTNGADLDNAFIKKIEQTSDAKRDLGGTEVVFLEPPTTPKELVSQITEADVVLSHRLHANIIAFSYGIPTVGLGWDNKLRSFFESTGRQDFYIGSSETDIDTVVRKIHGALAKGYDETRRSEVISEARTAIDDLIPNMTSVPHPLQQRKSHHAAPDLPILKT